NGVVDVHRRFTDRLEEAIVLIRDNNTDQYAGFTLARKIPVCGRNVFATNIEGLVMFLSEHKADMIPDGQFRAHLPLERLRSETHASFITLDHTLSHHRKFQIVQSELCQLESKLLATKLRMMAGESNPYIILDLFGPGHTMVRAGATAYVIQCVGVEVERFNFHNCTQEIPVTYSNQTMFADPITFILHAIPTILPCSDVFPSRYNLNGNWVCATPTARPCQAPEQLKPTMGTNKFQVNLEGFGKDVFTQTQKSQNRDFLTSITSRGAVLQAIGNAATKQRDPGSTSTIHLLPPDSIERIVTQVQEQTFPFFHLVGKHYSAILGILIIFYLLKIFIDFIIRVFLTVRSHGCGWWIFTAFSGLAFVLMYVPARMFKATTTLIREDEDREFPTRGTELVQRPHTYKELKQQLASLAQPDEPIYATIRSRNKMAARKDELPTPSAPPMPDDDQETTQPFLAIHKEHKKDNNELK
ncbi:MAG: hypothetical protein ACPF9Z_08145, partial [Paracoccaceae bacterium]